MKKAWMTVTGLHAVLVGGLMLGAGCGTTRPPEAAPTTMPPVTPEAVAPAAPTPVVEEAKPPVAEVQSKTYVVKSGDALSTISKRFKVSKSDIMKLNKISNPDKIRVGQKLKLPGYVDLNAPAPKVTHKKKSTAKTHAVKAVAGADTYVVKSGDTLGHIAAAHKTTSKAIKQANSLASDRLQVGQKLALPKGAATVAAEETPAPAAAEGTAPAEVTEGAAPAEGAATALTDSKPGDVLHVVEPNQDLNSIAMMYGVRSEEVMKLNNLSSPDVKVGQTLKIPPPVQ